MCDMCSPGRTPAKVAWRAGHANICRLLERWTAPSAPPAPPVTHHEDKRPGVTDYIADVPIICQGLSGQSHVRKVSKISLNKQTDDNELHNSLVYVPCVYLYMYIFVIIYLYMGRIK